jgi:hypothetical protein
MSSEHKRQLWLFPIWGPPAITIGLFGVLLFILHSPPILIYAPFALLLAVRMIQIIRAHQTGSMTTLILLYALAEAWVVVPGICFLWVILAIGGPINPG